jgi:hypothetical protein
MAYCAPGSVPRLEKHGTCFDATALRKLASIYNKHYPTRAIENVGGMSDKQLKVEMEKRFSESCDEMCWVKKLGVEHDPVIEKHLLPKMPEEWKEAPRTWLTNFNIEVVMRKYEDLYSDFVFMDVYPSDFCSYNGVCDIPFDGKYYGMIINLSDHTGSGSHWTALFVCTDKKMACYGAYYYDSVGNAPPKEMKALMDGLKKKGGATFKTVVNKKQHQYKNTECGMFSMFYIIKWLHWVHKDPTTTHLDIVRNRLISDDHVFQLRKIFFRTV